MLDNRPKLKKIAKYLIFILYTWLIYNLNYLIMTPYTISQTNLLTFIIDGFLTLSSYNFFLIVSKIIGALFTRNYWIILILFLCFAIPIFFWFRKQTIFRAWMVAVSGFIAGPGIFFIIGSFRFGPVNEMGLIGFLAMNVLFPLLMIANWAQKRYWPGNKFCDRVRRMLRWPCLKP